MRTVSEQRRWVAGYEGLYSLDRSGVLWRHWKTRMPTAVQGYWHKNKWAVKLSDGQGQAKELTLSRLVWETWFGPIPKTHVITHRNNNKSDNHPENLRMERRCDRAKVTGAKSRSKPVELLDESREVVDSWPSARKAAKDLAVSPQTVTNICNKKVKKAPIVNVRWAKKEREW
ncbi:MAG: HNH endonuclease [Turicibacter sp.]|nr:HNH endonuclease [Turicibacter sp.]